MRAVRNARSVGRPSRLKKPPGIFPAAYIRSSTSTVSGKKSAPSNLHSLVSSGLPAQPQFLDQCPISLQVVLLEIVQEPTTAADELEQPAPRIVILRMRPQVLGQLVDPLRQQRDLHLRRARVGLVRPVLTDDLLFSFLRKAHASPLSRQSQQSAGSGRKAAAASRDRVAMI